MNEIEKLNERISQLTELVKSGEETISATKEMLKLKEGVKMYKLYRADRYHEPVCKGEYDSLEEAEIAKAEMEHYIEDEPNAEYWIEDDYDGEVVG